MKKFTTVIVALLFTVGIFAGCSGKSTTTSTNNSSTESSDSKSQPISKSYVDLMKTGKYLMHYKATITSNGQSVDIDSTMAIDGGAISATTVTSGVKAHMIIKDKTFYMINDDSKTYMKFTSEGNSTLSASFKNVEDDKINTAGITYTGSGKDTINGKELKYEEYKTDAGTLRYYLDGNNLYAIVVKSAESQMTMIIVELSDKVDASMFEVPSGYTEMKI
ncbi:MAG: hypothetical protein ACM3X7_00645 [Solirubrobacterales bacterium]